MQVEDIGHSCGSSKYKMIAAARLLYSLLCSNYSQQEISEADSLWKEMRIVGVGNLQSLEAFGIATGSLNAANVEAANDV